MSTDARTREATEQSEPIETVESELQEESSESEAASSSDNYEDEDYMQPHFSSSTSASSSDMEVETENGDTTADSGGKNDFVSKDGRVWEATPEHTYRYSPMKTPRRGPTQYALSRINSVLSSFRLFITDEFIGTIVEKTNAQGRKSMNRSWKDVDATDMLAYIGVLILAGVYKSRGENAQSLWSESSGRAIFSASMALSHFRRISRSIRFADKEHRRGVLKKDKFAAIRDLWEKWVHRLPMMFNPGDDVCVDEQLVAFRGSCSFRQYMPSKPAKYGIKIWVTADVETSYAWKLQVYTGKEAGAAPEVGQGKRVVLEMVEGLQGRTVTCDNFFTSYALAEELLNRRMALVGTIRRNKPEIPPFLRHTAGRAPLSSLFAFTQTHTTVSYIPKRGKNVLLLSTKHRDPDIAEGPKRKPLIIMDYNHCKGAVDNLDKVVNTYSTKRKTRRWPTVVFANMIDISCYNAFVLFTAVEPSWNKSKSFRRRLFLEELGKALVAPAMAARRRTPRNNQIMLAGRPFSSHRRISKQRKRLLGGLGPWDLVGRNSARMLASIYPTSLIWSIT